MTPEIKAGRVIASIIAKYVPRGTALEMLQEIENEVLQLDWDPPNNDLFLFLNMSLFNARRNIVKIEGSADPIKKKINKAAEVICDAFKCKVDKKRVGNSFNEALNNILATDWGREEEDFDNNLIFLHQVCKEVSRRLR